MSVRKGYFLSFEGIDGSGKTTQAGLVARWLREAGLPVRHTREPGGTPLGRRLRRVLLAGGAELDHRAELMLYLADRAQHLHQVIRPALAAGKVVVCERYHDSTIAYQAFGRGLARRQVERCCRLAGPEQPDLTVLLEVAPAVALQRLGGDLDRLEEQGLAFLERVAAGYRLLAAAAPRRFLVIPSQPRAEQTFALLQAALVPRLQQAGIWEGGARA